MQGLRSVAHRQGEQSAIDDLLYSSQGPRRQGPTARFGAAQKPATIEKNILFIDIMSFLCCSSFFYTYCFYK